MAERSEFELMVDLVNAQPVMQKRQEVLKRPPADSLGKLVHESGIYRQVKAGLGSLSPALGQRLFIASDRRFLPADVRPPRRVLFLADDWTTAFFFGAALEAADPSSAAMARLIRSRSFL